jgi:hypothetical protein
MPFSATQLDDLSADQLRQAEDEPATPTEWSYFSADDEEWADYETAAKAHGKSSLMPDGRHCEDSATQRVGWLLRSPTSSKPMTDGNKERARMVVAQLIGNSTTDKVTAVRFIALPCLYNSGHLAGENALSIKGKFLPVAEIHDLRYIEFYEAFYNLRTNSAVDWATSLHTIRRRVARTLMLEFCEEEKDVKGVLKGWGKRRGE